MDLHGKASNIDIAGGASEYCAISKVFALNVQWLPVRLHQLLQLLHIGPLQLSHLLQLFLLQPGELTESQYLFVFLEEDEGGHGGDLVLSRHLLNIVHVHL